MVKFGINRLYRLPKMGLVQPLQRRRKTMNMRAVESERQLDMEYRLEDRYRRENGTVFLTGTQALVRILVEQARSDRAAGINTGGLVSGYRGSPLGGFDQEL